MPAVEAPPAAGAAWAAQTGVPAASELTPRTIKAALACLLGQMFGSSLLAFGALPLVMLPMTREFGWSETAFAGAVTFLMICGACSGPLIGRFVDRAGVRRTIMAGTAIVGLTTAAIGFVQGSLISFYLAYALLGIFGSTALGYAKVISALFVRNRAKALAIFGAEATLAGAVAPLIVEAIQSQHGWRAVYFALGALVLATLPFQYFLLVEPERSGESAAAGAAPSAASGLSGREARASGTYWLLVAAVVLAAAPRLGFMTYIVPVLAEKGFGSAVAAWAIACVTIAAPIGSLIAGAVMDRFPTPRVAIPFYVVALLATGMLAVVAEDRGGTVALLATCLLFGLTFQVHIPVMSYLPTRYFGLRSFTENYALAVAILAISIGALTPLLGYARATTGSGDTLLLIIALALAGSMVAFLRLPAFPGERRQA